MKKLTLLSILISVLFAFAAAPKVDLEAQAIAKKDEERRLVMSQLETARDSLQRLITAQYSAKQQYVEQREADKEELENLRGTQEKLNNELARIKEEKLSREQVLEDEKKALVLKQDEQKYFNDQLKDMYQKESDGLLEVFPLDREERRGNIEKIKAVIAQGSPAGVSFRSFVEYRMKWFAIGDSVSLTGTVVLPEASGPKDLTIARFGNMFGYGMDSSGNAYYLRQTGRLGTERFAVEKVEAPEVATEIATAMNGWMQTSSITGNVPVEVLQNDQSRQLISGKKVSAWQELYHSLEQGGLIMIPILLLPFWILYLTLSKVLQYRSVSTRMRKQFKESMEFIKKGDFAGAKAYAESCKNGVFAQMVKAVVERKSLGRDVGERAVYELLSLEAPLLNRNLNTVAVIAGAAPLLGLLGTISGMITLFAAVTQSGTGDPKALAGGISEALVTAKTGLAVAIPALFIHDLLRASKDRLVSEMEKSAVDLLHAVYPGE